MRLAAFAALLPFWLSACSESSRAAEVDPEQTPVATPATPGAAAGERACACGVAVKDLASPTDADGTPCPDCSFTHAVICSTRGSECHFTGDVFRSGCATHGDNQWAVDLRLNCGDPAQALTFHCDDDERIPGYELSLNCAQD